MSKFNLIEERWIPVRFFDGSRDELGISATLLQSKEIAAIEDQSPLVVAALHRFLLAVLYRALEGPTDIEQAKALFKTGLPHDKITAYLEKWRDRFWLFDEKYPFGQVPSIPETEAEPWTKLTAEYNATTNKVLFDHSDTTALVPVPPASATKWLIATLNFSVRGGRGYRPSPSADGLICITEGKNLQQTLLCSLVPYPNRTMIRTDLPIWEKEPLTYSEFKLGKEKAASGYADLYTWQARAMRLLQTDNGEIAQVAFIAGIGHIESELKDPMVPYKLKKNAGIEQAGLEDRGVWRGFDSLLPDGDSADGLEPRVINHLYALSRAKLIDNTVSLLIIGQKFKNATVEFWRMEQFKLPSNIADNKFMKIEIISHLNLSKEVGDVLEASLRKIAKSLITKGDRELMPDKWVAGKLKPGDVTKFITPMGVLPQYWTILEPCFHTVLNKYILGHDSDDIRLLWVKSVKDALQTAWNQQVVAVSSGEAWAIRALVKAEKKIRIKLKELRDDINKLTPEKEEL